MSHTPHKPLPAGCDQQSRYTTRKPQLVDVMPRDYQPPTDQEIFRRADDAVIARFRNGQPKAGEDCADVEPRRHPLTLDEDLCSMKCALWIGVAMILGALALRWWLA